MQEEAAPVAKPKEVGAFFLGAGGRVKYQWSKTHWSPSVFLGFQVLERKETRPVTETRLLVPDVVWTRLGIGVAFTPWSTITVEI